MTGRKKIIILIMAVSLMAIPFGSSAVAKTLKYPIKNSAECMTADFALVRPLQLVSLVSGAVVFVVSLPFSALGGNVDEAFNLMIADSARMTFTRPLGVF